MSKRKTEIPELDKLKESLDKSSQINRILGLSFAFFIFYVGVLVASTTDLMLFIPDSGFSIPLVDLQLPLIPFYIVAPFVILIFHYNLLFNLHQHSMKLLKWQEQNTNPENNIHLYPFLFNYTIQRINPLLSKTLNLVIRITIFMLPLGLLLLVLIRFADYQDWYMTTWHFVALLLDAALISTHTDKILMVLKSGNNNYKEVFTLYDLFNFSKSKNLFIRITKNTLLFLYKILPFLITVCLSLLIKLLGFGYALFVTFKIWDTGQIKNSIHYQVKLFRQLRLEANTVHLAILYFLFYITIMTINLDKYLSFEMDKLGFTVLKKVVPRLVLIEENLVRTEPENEIIQLYLNDSLNKQDRENIKKEFTQGYVIKGRSFKFADFYSANLINADFRQTDLRWADFTNANHYGANFENALFRGIVIHGVQLQNYDFRFSDFLGADLREANLQGADLTGACLQETNFRSSILKEANLKGSDLQGADFSMANLKKANLNSASLQMSCLNKADLEGVILWMANLKEADLSGAFLQEANLGGANLEGANLKGANLESADLGNAILNGADLENARLNGAQLFNACLQGANLSNAELQGADLSYANLQYVYFIGTDLKGANLTGANLKCAVIVVTDLEGVILRRANLQGIDFNYANLQGADLNYVTLNGKIFHGVKLRGAQIKSNAKDTILVINNITNNDSSFFDSNFETNLKRIAELIKYPSYRTSFIERMRSAKEQYNKDNNEVYIFPQSMTILKPEDHIIDSSFFIIRRRIAVEDKEIAQRLLENTSIYSEPKDLSDSISKVLYDDLYNYLQTNYPEYLRGLLIIEY